MALEHYDSGQTLVIDPVLVYSTYLGGSGDEDANGLDGKSIAVLGDPMMLYRDGGEIGAGAQWV